jgi:hypothetical protein
MGPESGRLMEHRALYFTIIMNKGDLCTCAQLIFLLEYFENEFQNDGRR